MSRITFCDDAVFERARNRCNKKREGRMKSSKVIKEMLLLSLNSSNIVKAVPAQRIRPRIFVRAFLHLSHGFPWKPVPRFSRAPFAQPCYFLLGVPPRLSEITRR